MGLTIWLDVEGRNEADELPSDCSIMLRLEQPLETLAERLGMKPLKSFYDDSAVAAELADMLDEADAADIELPPAKWFDPAEPLATFAALHERLVAHPSYLGVAFDESRAHWPAALLDELTECRSTLVTARDDRRRVRLLLVP